MSKVIMLRVGASAEASLSTVFDPLAVSAKKAAAQVARESSRASATARSETAKSAREAANAAAKVAREGQRAQQAAERANEANARAFRRREEESVRAAQRAAQERTKIAQREFDARLRESSRARRAEEREIVQTARQARRVEQRATEETVRSRRDMAGRVIGAIGSIAGRGLDIAKGGLSGMGLDLGLGSLMGKNVNLSAVANKVTQSGMMSQGKTPTIADVRATEEAIRKAGSATAQDYGQMAAALDNFVGATGDLEGGKAALEELGKIANVTGTPLADLGLLAGKLNKDLGNVPNKADRVSDALRNLAIQGMMGNVELEDLAKFGGRISGMAFKFAGDRNQTIAELGAAAQISMQGGRVDAAEATNSAARFASQMGNENVQENIRGALGKDFQFYTDASHQKMRGPAELITDIVSRANGDNDKIAAAFKNVMSKSVIEGFTSIFLDAGGGAKGKQALADTFKNFSKSLSKETLDKGNALTMESDASKIANANNKLADAALKVAPALESLVPIVVSVASVLSNNLGAAIVAAITASIAKAALGDVLKDAIKDIIAPTPTVPTLPNTGVNTPAVGGDGTNTATKVVAGIAAFTGGYKATEELMKVSDNLTNAGNNEDTALRGRLVGATMTFESGGGNMPELLSSFIEASDRLEVMKRATGGARDDSKIAGFQEANDNAWKAIMGSGALAANPFASQAMQIAGFDPAQAKGPIESSAGAANADAKVFADAAASLKAAGLGEAGAALQSAASALTAAASAIGASGAGAGGSGVNPAGRA